MSYLIRRVLAKPRLILEEMCRLYGKFASYLRRVLHKTRLIFPRINGPIEDPKFPMLLLGNPVTMQVEIYFRFSYFERFWTASRGRILLNNSSERITEGYNYKPA